MKRLVCVLVVLVLAGVAGCRSTERKKGAIAFVPKIKGIPYFTACQRGAEEAAGELGLLLDYNGPTRADSNLQIQLLRGLAASGDYDCLAVACTEKDRVSPALAEARSRGMHVVTYDADAQPEAREYFVNMATYDDVAKAMVDALLEELGPRAKGKIGIVTSSLEAPNQAEWARRIKEYLRKWPDLVVLPEVVHGEDREKGIELTGALVRAHRDDLVGILGLTSVAVPAAAEAVRQEKLAGKIRVTGVSTPRDMRDYVQDGTVRSFILWSPVDLGYLTVHVCDLVRRGQMPPSRTGTITAGRLGKIQVNDGEVLLGKPLKFTKENIDQYDF